MECDIRLHPAESENLQQYRNRVQEGIFKEIIERGLGNNMPRDAKLIILGQIIYAVTRDELTNQEAWQLEEMLGNRNEWQNALNYAIFGELQEIV